MSFDYAEFFRLLYKHEKERIDRQQPEGEAICFECGATVPVDEVANGYEQQSTAPCGHSWFSYRHDGQYVLE